VCGLVEVREMIKLKDIKFFRDIFCQHNGVMTTAELKECKIYYADIQWLIEEGLLEKVRRGYYHWIGEESDSEVMIINRLFPDAVLCMETAIFYYGYSDRTPAEWHLTVNKNISGKRIKIDYPFIKVYRIEPLLLPVGVSKGEIDDIKVCIYDRDRTICDVLRNMNKMDREIFNKAIQNYVNDPKKNIPNLMQYAKELRVQKRVRDLIGVWL
jgi:predicted transcriptional regulator of viral defense system